MEVNTIIVYSILISFFWAFSHTSHIKKILIILIISLICVYVEYDAFLKNQKNINNYDKIIYLIIDYIHNIIFLSVFFLICIAITLKCNLTYVFMLNIFAFVTILLFFYFKECILSLLMYNIIDIKHWIQPIERIKYMLGFHKQYNIRHREPNHDGIYDWINSQYLLMSVLLLLNIYCFMKQKRC